jgi:hypothetical protein
MPLQKVFFHLDLSHFGWLLEERLGYWSLLKTVQLIFYKSTHFTGQSKYMLTVHGMFDDARVALELPHFKP